MSLLHYKKSYKLPTAVILGLKSRNPFLRAKFDGLMRCWYNLNIPFRLNSHCARKGSRGVWFVCR